MAYRAKGEPDRAIPDYDRAIKLNRNDAVALRQPRPRLSRHPRLRARASRISTRRSRSIPDYILALNDRGIAYAAKGNVERAIQDFDQAILLDPRDGFAYNNRGLAYRNRGEVDRAIKDYDQAILLNSNYVLAYYNRGNAYLRQARLRPRHPELRPGDPAR